MNDYKLFKNSVYSNRPGYNTIDPVYFEKLQNNYSRLIQYIYIKIDIDTDSCYNLIVPNLDILLLQKYGINSKIYLVQYKTLIEIKYKFITDLDISEKHYQHYKVFPIYGTDQDSAVFLIV